MQSGNDRVFHHHADAHAVGGFVEKPFQKTLTTPASVSLAPAGGHTSARTTEMNFEDLITHRSAYTRVSGESNNLNAAPTTLTTSVVEGLNILEIVTAERVVCQISIEHPLDGGPNKVNFAGTRFEGLCVFGKDVTPTIRFAHSTFQTAPGDVNTPWLKRTAFLKTVQDQADTLLKTKGVPAWINKRYGWMATGKKPADKGSVICSLVDNLAVEAPAKAYGHIIEIPDFGRIFLAELVTDGSSFRLVMLRTELGCTIQGQQSFGIARSNGGFYPP